MPHGTTVLIERMLASGSAAGYAGAGEVRYLPTRALCDVRYTHSASGGEARTGIAYAAMCLSAHSARCGTEIAYARADV
eukprot:692647-Rhodomonas_salina.3